MRTIPESVQTLLKSRSMIGANKPSFEVTIGTSTIDADDPTKWSEERLVENYGYGNVCPTKNNGAIVSYVDGTAVKVALAYSMGGILTGTESFGTGAVIKSSVANARTSMNLIDNILYLAISFTDPTVPNVLRAELWTDETGLGTSFAKMSDISTRLHNATSYSIGTCGAVMTAVEKLGNGNLVILTPYLVDIFGNGGFYDGQQAHYSSDNGATWTNGARHWHGASSGNCTSACGAIAHISDSSFITTYRAGLNNYYIYTWTNSGALVEGQTVINDGGVNTWTGAWGTYTPAYRESFFVIGDELYMRHGNYTVSDNYVRKYVGTMPPTAAGIANCDNWEIVLQYSAPSGSTSHTVVSGIYAISSSHSGNAIYVLGITASVSGVPVKSINISRNKNMAASLELSIDNKNGEWSPDNTVHPNVLWPNTTVTVSQGYGDNKIITFTGLIDSIEMSTFPQEIKLSCRDYLKKALDQIVTMPWGDGYSHNLTYWDRTPEWIFADLCGKCGLIVVTAETTGITINEITFSWCSYADAFQQLAEMVGGYEFGCDESGQAYFRKEEITDSPTTNYTFREGEDIISLGYTIDDADISHKVAVYGQSAEDENGETHTVFAAAEYPSRTYYNVLPQKFCKVDASELKTAAQCQAVADETVRLMSSRVRICQFSAVGVPWLQVGDYIQVIESSTTISEMYRITDLSTTMSDSGYTMSITCYHHSYTE